MTEPTSSALALLRSGHASAGAASHGAQHPDQFVDMYAFLAAQHPEQKEQSVDTLAEQKAAKAFTPEAQPAAEKTLPTPAPAATTDPAPQPPPPPPPLPPQHRIIAIGDTHGDLAALKRALTVAGVIDAAGAWSGGSTSIVQIGDLVRFLIHFDFSCFVFLSFFTCFPLVLRLIRSDFGFFFTHR